MTKQEFSKMLIKLYEGGKMPEEFKLTGTKWYQGEAEYLLEAIIKHCVIIRKFNL